MLSDEEKKAVEILNKWLCKTHSEFCKIGAVGIPNEEFFATEIVLSLIKKQSKEIEHQKEKRANQRNELAILNAKQIEFNKLVNTVNSYKGQFKRQEKEIEELKEKDDANLAYYDQIYQNGIYTGQKAVEDKIKAKIEEVEQWELYNMKIPRLSTLDERLGAKIGIKYVLQSLLEEKE